MLADLGWKAAKWPGGPNNVESVPPRCSADDLLEEPEDDDDPEPAQLDGWGPNINPPASEHEESEEEVDPDECSKFAPDEIVPEAVDDVKIGERLGYPGIRP